MSSTTAAAGQDVLTAGVSRHSSRAHDRPDIDGLRALAVMAVVAFHAEPRIVPGGFAGVDVFFVISGYLITRLLVEQAEGARTLRGFIERRIRRIFPALVLVLAATMVVGWQVLLPSEWLQLCRHVAAASGFVVNLAFWREAGYFDAAAVSKPLLHLWSLAVEEQFYLLWPLVVFACAASAPRVRRVASWIVVASFALNLWWVTRDGAAAFFLLPTRSWELGAGALLACMPAAGGLQRETGRRREVLALVGVVLLAVAFARLDGTRHYPGGWALLPVLGTAAVIGAGAGATVNRVLASAPLVYVGLISFPLYLWHWPALSFARTVAGDELRWQAIAAAIGVATVLAALTYRWLELPLRALRRLPTVPLVLALAAVASAALAGAGGQLAPRHSDGATAAWDAALHDWDYPGAAFTAAKVGDGLSVRTAGAGRTVLVIGDSNAQQYAPRFARLLATAHPRTRVMFATAGSCPPMRGLEFVARPGCPAIAERAFAYAAGPGIDVVVLAAQWTAYLDPAVASYDDGQRSRGPDAVRKGLAEFTRTLAALRDAGKRVYVVLNVPVGPMFESRRLLRRSWLGPFDVLAGGSTRAAWAASSAFASVPLRAAAERAGAIVIDPADWLCATGTCPAVDASGAPLYRDGFHLRAAHVRENVRYLDSIVVGGP